MACFSSSHDLKLVCPTVWQTYQDMDDKIADVSNTYKSGKQPRGPRKLCRNCRDPLLSWRKPCRGHLLVMHSSNHLFMEVESHMTSTLKFASTLLVALVRWHQLLTFWPRCKAKCVVENEHRTSPWKHSMPTVKMVMAGSILLCEALLQQEEG